MTPTHATDFTGKLLIAMPGMGDPRFDRSVIFICSHTDEGAMGLIVNKPAKDITFRDLLGQLGIETKGATNPPPICFGGPVEHSRGFVLHSTDYGVNDATINVPGGFRMTATLDVLEDIAGGGGPTEALLALGYSGWGPGQLEDELADNGWLVCNPTLDLVFHAKNPKKWTLALAELGVDALMLSATGGRA